MSTPLDACFVSLRYDNDPASLPIGCGFLISGKIIVTAAHVVESILGLRREAGPALGACVWASFPAIQSSGKVRIFRTQVVEWGLEQDIDFAILELDSEPPEGSKPAELTPAGYANRHSFQTLGFPHQSPIFVFAAGEVVAKAGDGLLQIEAVRVPGYPVQPGFSGSPVWDEQKQGVIGMVVQADITPEVKAAFILPIEVISQHSAYLPQAPGTLHRVPPLPPHYTPRPAELARLRQALVSNAGAPVCIHGMGGIGKSTLAAALAHDPEVRQAFPDGIHWLNLGDVRPSNPGSSDPHLKERQAQVAEALGGPVENLRGVEERLQSLLQQATCLVILDNVWDAASVQGFICLNSSSRFLITTRQNQVGLSLQAQMHSLDILDEALALDLLARCSKVSSDRLPPEARQIVQECGHLPLALEIVGALLQRMGSWQELLTLLQDNAWPEIPPGLSNYPYGLLGAIQTSIDTLFEEQRQRYYDLAAFPGHSPVPYAVLEKLWTSQGLKSYAVRITLSTLEDRSLLRQNEWGEITLHDLQWDYLHSQAPGMQARKAAAVNALRTWMNDSQAPEPERQLAALWLTRLGWLDPDPDQIPLDEIITYLKLVGHQMNKQAEYKNILDQVIIPALRRKDPAPDDRQLAWLYNYSGAYKGESRRFTEAQGDYEIALAKLSVLQVESPDLHDIHSLEAIIKLGAGGVLCELAQKEQGEPPDEQRLDQQQPDQPPEDDPRVQAALKLFTEGIAAARYCPDDPILLVSLLKETACAATLLNKAPGLNTAESQAAEALSIMHAEIYPIFERLYKNLGLNLETALPVAGMPATGAMDSSLLIQKLFSLQTINGHALDQQFQDIYTLLGRVYQIDQQAHTSLPRDASELSSSFQQLWRLLDDYIYVLSGTGAIHQKRAKMTKDRAEIQETAGRDVWLNRAILILGHFIHNKARSLEAHYNSAESLQIILGALETENLAIQTEILDHWRQVARLAQELEDPELQAEAEELLAQHGQQS